MKKIILLIVILGTVVLGVNTVSAQGAKLNKKSITVKVALKKKLKVKGYSGKIKWKSNDPEIAAVSSKGVVKAKDTGSTKITAKTKNGRKLTCRVKVVANKISRLQIKKMKHTVIEDAKEIKDEIYELGYNANGSIYVIVKVTNNTGYYQNISEYYIKASGKNHHLGNIFSQQFKYGDKNRVYWQLAPHQTYTVKLEIDNKHVKKVVDLGKIMKKNGIHIQYGLTFKKI